ncbi:hypothetical protein M446_4121 [Methylobacterium sp. 4-46]|uniref:hypothetical protein n=1 Tax=unclassified Methylobacterium TaxID=2615210 RepID=UPI000152E7F9|nr:MULTISPECIES: hypothetical protein [Methylobacterium]ACA18478.1 hypothetical protein M446_4121 [Methylobacterium sp. 4-46]WFT77767.1 hypothetical protein QA634_20930 [Methylobacterium nodulans]
MTTRILELPLLTTKITTALNEDWRDALQFPDADNTPIPLAGMAFRGTLRESVDGAAYFYLASSGVPTPTGVPRVDLLVVGDGTVLGIVCPVTRMRSGRAGTYIFDIRAFADGVTRRCVNGTATIERGVDR